VEYILYRGRKSSQGRSGSVWRRGIVSLGAIEDVLVRGGEQIVSQKSFAVWASKGGRNDSGGARNDR